MLINLSRMFAPCCMGPANVPMIRYVILLPPPPNVRSFFEHVDHGLTNLWPIFNSTDPV